MNEKKYLKTYQKVAYGAGDLASNCSYGLVSSFLLLYLSDVLGMNTGIVGTLMLISKIFDGITDIFFGNLIDKTKSKLGKARPWMLYAQIGVSLCLIALFSIPSMGQTAQYAYFFAFYTCLNAIFYTANGVAYSTLSALITYNKNERVQLGSIRFMFAVFTNIVMGFAVTGAVEAFGGGASGWRAVAIICAVIGLVVNTISCLSVKEVEGESPIQTEDKPEDDKLSFLETIKVLFANKYYILMLILYIVYYTMSNITTGSGVYFTTYVLGDASLLGMFQMMKMFPVIIALIFTPMLVKKCKSMQKVNFYGYVINCILSVLFIYFAYVKNVGLMLLFMFIKGIFAGTLSGTLNALVAEISGYTYRTKNVRMDGTIFSLSSLGVKIGGGIGTAAVGWLLALGGYVGTAEAQTAGAINMIFALYVVIPVIFSVIITIILGFMKVEKANKDWDESHGINA
jgi:GPH family glycoside/pentoside/hexuronide:cation symporter